MAPKPLHTKKPAGFKEAAQSLYLEITPPIFRYLCVGYLFK